MADLLTKAALAGLGFLSLTRTRAEEIVESLVKEGKIAKSDEAKLVKRLLTRAEENKKLLEKRVKETVSHTLVKLNLPTRKEIQELKEEIKKLNQKISK